MAHVNVHISIKEIINYYYWFYKSAKGVDVPQIGEKRPRPGTRIRPKQQQRPNADQRTEGDTQVIKEETSESGAEPVADVASEPKEEVKDSWDADSSSSDEDVAEEETRPIMSAETTKTLPAKPAADTSTDESAQESVSEEDGSSESGSDSSTDDDVDKKAEASSRREKALQRIQVGCC